MIYGFVETEKANHSISTMCRVLKVSKSGYYDWRGRPPSRRAQADAALTERIERVHRDSRGTYGAPRVHAELRALGARCSRKRVARLMRNAGICGCGRRRRARSTTRRDTERAPAAPDLARRDFVPGAPDRLWVADITYVSSWEGWLYLAFVLDAHSRRKVVGWSMANHLRTELVLDALEMALWNRHPAPGLIHHSDRGSQYTSVEFSAAGSRRPGSSLRWAPWRMPTITRWPSRSWRR